MQQVRDRETQLAKDIHIKDSDLRGFLIKCLLGLVQIEDRSYIAPKLLLEEVRGGGTDEVVILQQENFQSSKAGQLEGPI